MFFEVCPNALIKDKDFKTLFLTAQSSGHELHPWHGKSSNTPQVLTLPQRENNKLCTGLSLQALEKYTLVLIHSWILANVCVISEHNHKLLWVQRIAQAAQGYLGGKSTSGCITLCPWEYSSGLIWSWVDCEDTQLGFWASSCTIHVPVNVFYLPREF